MRFDNENRLILGVNKQTPDGDQILSEVNKEIDKTRTDLDKLRVHEITLPNGDILVLYGGRNASITRVISS